jgi:tetratricopeptide (TPR) repeat protein
MLQAVHEFMRYTAPDPEALARSIEATRVKLAHALEASTDLPIVDFAADLGSMLTTARMEAAAVELLQPHMVRADASSHHEPAAWFWNAYATALQYCGRRAEAEPYFARALEVARSGGWRPVEALILHHWGRSLVEQGNFTSAEARIAEALRIRVELNEPRQESSRKALLELAALQARDQAVHHAQGDA